MSQISPSPKSLPKTNAINTSDKLTLNANQSGSAPLKSSSYGSLNNFNNNTNQKLNQNNTASSLKATTLMSFMQSENASEKNK